MNFDELFLEDPGQPGISIRVPNGGKRLDEVSENRHPGWSLDSSNIDIYAGAYFIDKGNNKYDTTEENTITKSL